jgi:Reverse transcriptase (RNA-dependent DNA polymerase)
MDTLRIFLAIVAAENLKCRQFDIKNAFTESILRERVFLSAPQGVEVRKGYVLRVLRSLYGLKQAARD